MNKEDLFSDCPCYTCLVRAACKETCYEVAKWYRNQEISAQKQFRQISIFKKKGLSNEVINIIMEEKSSMVELNKEKISRFTLQKIFK